MAKEFLRYESEILSVLVAMKNTRAFQARRIVPVVTKENCAEWLLKAQELPLGARPRRRGGA